MTKKTVVSCVHCEEDIVSRKELSVVSVGRRLLPLHDRCVSHARPEFLYWFSLRVNSRRLWIDFVLVNAFILLPLLLLPDVGPIPLLVILAIANAIFIGMRLASYFFYERKLPKSSVGRGG